MARRAGDSDTYDFCLLDKSTGKIDKSVVLRFPSVTTILHKTLAAPGLNAWYERTSRDLIVGALSILREHPDWGMIDEDGFSFLDYLTDADYLGEWLKENDLTPKAIMDKASERGHTVHKTLEDYADAYAEGEMDGEPSQRAQSWMSERNPRSPFEEGLMLWLYHTNPNIMGSETLVISKKHNYAGTFDLLWVTEEGRLRLTDLKTRAAHLGAYESDHLQLAGYAIAYEEMTGIAVEERSVLLARDDGTYLEVVSDLDEGVFLNLLNVYNGLSNLRR